MGGDEDRKPFNRFDYGPVSAAVVVQPEQVAMQQPRGRGKNLLLAVRVREFVGGGERDGDEN